MENNQSNKTLSDYITIALQDPQLIYCVASVRNTEKKPVNLAFVARTEEEYNINGKPSGKKSWFNNRKQFYSDSMIQTLELELLSDGYDYSINASYKSPYILTPKDKERIIIPKIEQTTIRLQRPPKLWKIFGIGTEKDTYNQGWHQLIAETKIPQKSLPENEREAEMTLTKDLTQTLQRLTTAIEFVNKTTRREYEPEEEIQLALMHPSYYHQPLYHDMDEKLIAKSYYICTLNNIPIYVHHFNPHVGSKKTGISPPKVVRKETS
ncbi:MAG: hypothetical protein ABIJ21_08975 [Nanoarchaeota archaeon]